VPHPKATVFALVHRQFSGDFMGKNPNSFQKRQREMDKKRKAEDKRKKRLAQKNAPPIVKSAIRPVTDDEQGFAAS
jgi:hypothetical protein